QRGPRARAGGARPGRAPVVVGRLEPGGPAVPHGADGSPQRSHRPTAGGPARPVRPAPRSHRRTMSTTAQAPTSGATPGFDEVPGRYKVRDLSLAEAGRHQLREGQVDRKSTRLNSSHVKISYAVFCLKKKTKQQDASPTQHAR